MLQPISQINQEVINSSLIRVIRQLMELQAALRHHQVSVLEFISYHCYIMSVGGNASIRFHWDNKITQCISTQWNCNWPLNPIGRIFFSVYWVCCFKINLFLFFGRKHKSTKFTSIILLKSIFNELLVAIFFSWVRLPIYISM